MGWLIINIIIIIQDKWDEIQSSSRCATLRHILVFHRLSYLSSIILGLGYTVFRQLQSDLLDNVSFGSVISQGMDLPLCSLVMPMSLC